MIHTKICTKCGEEKPVEGFYSSRKKTTGGMKVSLKSMCKVCICKITGKYSKANLEKRRMWDVEWRAANREMVRAYAVKSYKKHHEKNVARSRRTYKRDPERWKAYSAKWQKDNHEKAKAARDKRRDLLVDSHVRGLIAKHSAIQRKNIPASLVRLKRAHIKLLREVKKHDDQERATVGG